MQHYQPHELLPGEEQGRFDHLDDADEAIQEEWEEWMEELGEALDTLKRLRRNTPYGFARYGGKLATGFDTFRSQGVGNDEEYPGPIEVLETFYGECQHDPYVWE